MSKIFYISDMHFGMRSAIKHDVDNAMRYDQQADSTYPFVSTEERDAGMIERWNARVSDSDLVYILGDIGPQKFNDMRKLMERLNGRKSIVRGNHDKSWISDLTSYPSCNVLKVCDYDCIVDRNRNVVLCHYPIFSWDKQRRGSYHVYGHVHNTIEDDIFQEMGRKLCNEETQQFRAMNAGAMVNDFEPKTLDEMIEKYRL